MKSGEQKRPEKNIVILISGEGSNMLAIARAAQQERWQQAFGARVACVISNRPDAAGLTAAAALGLPVLALDHRLYGSREAFDTALRQRIDEFSPALVVLAGFMRILTTGFVQHYAGRLINIHPSLLPAFTGLDTHQRAIDADCQFAGCTVHRVTPELDCGPMLAQAQVRVLPDDTARTLAARVQAEEHRIYPHAIRALLANEATGTASPGRC
jgi:phosphoribosylglycinamide formyltransferase 1